MIKDKNIHDKSYKDLFSNKDVFIKLIQNYVSDTWGSKLEEENLSLIDKSFILQDYEKIESDIVYKASIENQEVIFYILLEFQSTVDYSMPIRLFFYMSSIWREIVKNTEKNEFKRKDFKLPAIVPIVLYNGKERWTTTTKFKEKVNNADMFGNNVVDFEYVLLDVNRYNTKELMQKGDISSAIFLLDQDNNMNELLLKIRDIALYFDNLSDKDKNLIKHWLRNTVDNDIIKDIENVLDVDKREVDEMTSNVSKCINEYFEKAKKEGIEKGIQQGMQQGIQQGMQQGMQQGINQGEKNKAIDVAKKLISKGMDNISISEITDLSISEIENIRKEIN